MARSPLQLCTKPWQMVTRPKRNMHADSHTCGLSLFRIIFDGISKAIYGTKNMVKAVLYWFPVSLRSFWRPNTDALAMLVRSRKASRYMRLRTGITRRSILETSLRWEARHISVSALLLRGKHAKYRTGLGSRKKKLLLHHVLRTWFFGIN